jgi:serine/threonine protein kinase
MFFKTLYLSIQIILFFVRVGYIKKNMAAAPKMRLSDFDILQTVGTGSFGRVRIARNKTNGDYVALKILKKSEILRLK